ncbi:MAG: LPS export ABC transporter ATP-binding protein [Rhodobiaceae bacterium]|jgi:lipopolysaccharide export system ATP-binding protein|nr:LPS export ABC transporter ATP-binding protein [Rhodobiaceae bacterium]MDC3272201.1 LPS export ABC transporter ATP-binding protein [Hyphomicrobiales bacterium]|tara:strand:+ start:188 stop:919 length:732 start_codon:yes stop_codon:yes gene_type:complete
MNNSQGLQINNIGKSYNRIPVIHDISINLKPGEVIGLLGPNGAGKTTMFYIIMGLIKPDRGSIYIDGHNITLLPMYRRARLGVSYLPQEPSIFRGLTVKENIECILEISEKNKIKRNNKLRELLKKFGLEKIANSKSVSLSGGERRRVEIARALTTNPRFILMDEPFSGIDPLAINDIKGLIKNLTNNGIGVLITDHNVRETLSLVDRAYIVHDGNLLVEGSPDEIINDTDAKRVYLGDQFNL